MVITMYNCSNMQGIDSNCINDILLIYGLCYLVTVCQNNWKLGTITRNLGWKEFRTKHQTQGYSSQKIEQKGECCGQHHQNPHGSHD